MQVIAARQARLAAAADLLFVFHRITFFDLDGTQVAVQALKAAAVIDDHRIPKDSEKPREHHNAVIGGAFVLRACIVNFRTSLADIRALPGIITRLGAELDAALRPEALRGKRAETKKSSI